MRLGILKVDSVLENFQPQFGDYSDMFERLLRAADPSVELTIFDVLAGELPELR